MAHSEGAECAIHMAQCHDCLEEAIVIGIDDQGSLQVFTTETNRERLVVLLERAKLRIISQIARAERAARVPAEEG